MSIIYFILSLVVLFFSKSWLSGGLARMVHRFGGSRHNLIILWSIIFLPGTVIHELSHFFFAILTGARTGRVEILPEYLDEDSDEDTAGSSVALGYVQTQRLNPIQGFLVGTAPFTVGLVLLVWLGALIRQSYSAGDYWFTLLQGYLFFTVANSFFPSWPDIKQSIPLVIITSVFLIVFWILGFEVVWRPNTIYFSVLDTISLTLFISTAVNLLFVGVLEVIRKLFRG